MLTDKVTIKNLNRRWLDMRQKEIQLAWAKYIQGVSVLEEPKYIRLTCRTRRMEGGGSVRELCQYHFYLFMFYL